MEQQKDVAVEHTPTNTAIFPSSASGKEVEQGGDFQSHSEQPHGTNSLGSFECQFCGQRFKHKGFWERHEALHGTGPVRCLACRARFKGKHGRKELRQHYKEKHSQPKICPWCKEEFYSEDTLVLHIKHCAGPKDQSEEARSHGSGDMKSNHLREDGTTGKSPHPCCVCSQSFHSREPLLFHKAQTHGDRAATQEILKLSKSLSKEMARSAKGKNPAGKPPTRVMCHMCHKGFPTPAKLRTHLSWHLGEKPFPCPVCHKSFRRKDNLKQHLTIHAKKHPYPCDLCGESFRRQTQLRFHKVEAHDVKILLHELDSNTTKASAQKLVLKVRTPSSEPKKFLCHMCGCSFLSKSALTEHGYRVHLEQGRLRCEDCGKMFKLRPNLISHLRLHLGITPYQCSTCDQCFGTSTQLRKHERQHSGELPFPCPECGKLFGDVYLLKMHMRTHTGDRPYVCPVCGKAFGHYTTLRTHKRIHTGDKPFQCSQCSMAFTQRSSLTYHLRSHRGERPYACHVCGKAYTRMATLNIHLTRHTGQKRVACPLCDYTCDTPKHLRKHVAKAHQDCDNVVPIKNDRQPGAERRRPDTGGLYANSLAKAGLAVGETAPNTTAAGLREALASTEGLAKPNSSFFSHGVSSAADFLPGRQYMPAAAGPLYTGTIANSGHHDNRTYSAERTGYNTNVHPSQAKVLTGGPADALSHFYHANNSIRAPPHDSRPLGSEGLGHSTGFLAGGTHASTEEARGAAHFPSHMASIYTAGNNGGSPYPQVPVSSVAHASFTAHAHNIYCTADNSLAKSSHAFQESHQPQQHWYPLPNNPSPMHFAAKELPGRDSFRPTELQSEGRTYQYLHSAAGFAPQAHFSAQEAGQHMRADPEGQNLKPPFVYQYKNAHGQPEISQSDANGRAPPPAASVTQHHALLSNEDMGKNPVKSERVGVATLGSVNEQVYHGLSPSSRPNLESASRDLVQNEVKRSEGLYEGKVTGHQLGFSNPLQMAADKDTSVGVNEAPVTAQEQGGVISAVEETSNQEEEEVQEEEEEEEEKDIKKRKKTKKSAWKPWSLVLSGSKKTKERISKPKKGKKFDSGSRGEVETHQSISKRTSQRCLRPRTEVKHTVDYSESEYEEYPVIKRKYKKRMSQKRSAVKSEDIDYEDEESDDEDDDDRLAKEPKTRKKRKRLTAEQKSNRSSLQPATCPVCGKTFTLAANLPKHMRLHSGEKPYDCTICGHSFPRSDYLKNHMQSAHPTPDHSAVTCIQCGEIFTELAQLEPHVNEVHAGVRPFSCSVCTFSCLQLADLKRHVKYIHRNEESFLYQCAACLLIFSKAAELKAHVSAMHGGEEWEQQQRLSEVKAETEPEESWKGMDVTCTTNSRGEQQEAGNNMESAESRLEGEGGEEQENINAMQAGSLLKEERNPEQEGEESVRGLTGASPVRPYKCGHCGHLFKNIAMLCQHMTKKHTGEKAFKCGVCQVSYIAAHMLARHMLFHSGIRPCTCEKCGKSFADWAQLRKHLIVHTNSRPFTCSHCGQTFRHRNTLRTHERIHTGSKPFKCKTCDAAFSQRASLRYHERSHQGLKPYVCQVCGNRYTRATTLNVHMTHHTGLRRRACHLCEYTCDNNKLLGRHMTKVHPGHEMMPVKQVPVAY